MLTSLAPSPMLRVILRAPFLTKLVTYKMCVTIVQFDIILTYCLCKEINTENKDFDILMVQVVTNLAHMVELETKTAIANATNVQ
jgi:hypothetical protein